MMENFQKTIAAHGMLANDDIVLAALSGGADSVALLLLLLELRDTPKFAVLNIHAAHINHNLRGAESNADENFVREFCVRHNVPLRVFSADSAEVSTEESARQVRYSFLYKYAAEIGTSCQVKIATAHNQNDNAETLLLNLCRGSGLKGLAGIPPVRGHDGIKIIRPLLNTPRAAIESYLHSRKQIWRTDHTNNEEKFLRNRIRHSILPALAEINPKIISAVSDTATILREEEEFLDAQAAVAYESVKCRDTACRVRGSRAIRSSHDNAADMARHVPTITLDLQSLLQQKNFLQHRIIRLALARLTKNLKNISRRHIENILALTQTGKSINLPHGLTVSNEYGKIIFQPVTGYPDENIFQPLTKCNRLKKFSSGKCNRLKNFSFPLTLDKPVFIPVLNAYAVATHKINTNNSAEMCTKFFNCDRIDATLEIRSRQPGDIISIKGGSKKIKDELIDRKIPREQRDKIALLAHGSDILWVIDENGRTSKKHKPIPGCKLLAVRIYKQNTEENTNEGTD